MDYRPIILAALFSCAGVAHAGYAQLAYPERFSGSPGDWKFAPAANDAKFGNVVHQPKGLRVPIPGVPVTMPASYRFAANAPRFAAAALFISPHLRAAIGIAAWLGAAKIVWDEVNKRWVTDGISPDNEPSDGKQYRAYDQLPWSNSISSACAAGVAYYNTLSALKYVLLPNPTTECRVNVLNTNGTLNTSNAYGPILKVKDSSCPSGWYITPAGCVQTPPPKFLTEPEFIQKILNPDNQPGWPSVPADWPMPQTVPWEIGVPLPVQPPVINPEPGPNPQHQPKFIPTGDPVPNPKYDPSAPPSTDNQPWLQPGVRVTPRPTPDQPTRVDMTPTDRPQAGPDPDPNPDPEPDPDKDKPKPEEQQSLCEKHPEILACQVLKDSGEKPEIEKKDFDFDFTPETGFSGSASCPAPVTVNVSGMQLAFSWVPFCNSLSFAKPIILALAWLSAAFIMLGAKEQ